LTLGAVAKHFGCRPWQVRRLFESGILSEPQRLGAYRVFYPEQLPAIELALRQRGYLPAQEAAHVQ
jgi:DNA-binding transcriptional MerR regulator